MTKVRRIIERLTHSPRGANVKIHFLDKSACVDGGATKYTAKVQDDGFTSFIRMMKTTHTGADIGLDEVHAPMDDSVTPPKEMKVDSVSIWISGSDLHIDYTAHNGDFNTIDGEEIWANFVVPYGPEGPQLGKAGAYVSGANPTPEPTYTLDQIVQGVANEIDRRFGDASIRQDLENKVKDAIDEEGVVKSGNYSAISYQPNMDRNYQTFEMNAPGFWAWLRTKVPGADVAYLAAEQARLEKAKEAAALEAQQEAEAKVEEDK